MIPPSPILPILTSSLAIASVLVLPAMSFMLLSATILYFPFPFLLFFFLFSFLSSLIPFPCSFPYSLISFPFEGINGEGVPIVVVVEVEEVEVPLPLSSLTSSPPPLYHCHPFLLLLPFPYSSASFPLFRSSPLLCTPLLAPILLPLPPFSFLSARFIPPLLPTPLPSP